MRKPARPPTFEDYLQGHSGMDLVAQIIRGHLAIEALLIEIIRLRQPGDDVYKTRFPEKTAACVEHGFIGDSEKEALDSINDLRNDCAHILGHSLGYPQIFRILGIMGNSAIDFSDDRVWSDQKVLEQDYGIEGGVWEILHNAYHYLAYILSDNGGPDFAS